MTKEYPEIDAAISDFSMTATYIPQDLQTRPGHGHYHAEDLSRMQFKWSIQINYRGRRLLETPFSCGIGCFSDLYRPPSRWLNEDIAVLRHLMKEGHVPKSYSNIGIKVNGKKLEPELRTVVFCLVSDSSAIDYPSYEAWASDLGYDEDSRKGEATYRECLKIGLTLRAALGEAKLQELRDIYQDF